jgi:magnesium chelatase family protein
MPASSGPLRDRIDIHVEVPRGEYEKLSDDRLGEPTAAIQARVEAARQRQRERFNVGAKHFPGEDQDDPGMVGANASPLQIQCNADMVGRNNRCPAEVRQFCALDDTCRSLMRTAMSQWSVDL